MNEITGGNTQDTHPARRGDNRPVHEIRMGKIVATAWRNVAADGVAWYSVSLSRLYKDKDDAWKKASSLGVDDLLVAAQVLTAMRWWVAAQCQPPARRPGGGGENPQDAEDIPEFPF